MPATTTLFPPPPPPTTGSIPTTGLLILIAAITPPPPPPPSCPPLPFLQKVLVSNSLTMPPLVPARKQDGSSGMAQRERTEEEEVWWVERCGEFKGEGV